MSLTDLRYTKAEAKEESAKPGPSSRYGAGSTPWGLCLHLEKRELDLLGVKTPPGVGDELHISAIARVTQVSQQSGFDRDDSLTVALSIDMMSIDMQETAAEEAAEGRQTPAKETAESKGLRGRTILG